MPETIFIIGAVLFGGLVGSFLNVVILRLPQEGASIVFPSSHCPKCETPIHWYDNIPVVSFLILRGKCRQCEVKISWQYPLVELAMALLSWALIMRYGLSPAFGIYFVFAAALLAIIFIDLYHQIIPDVISLPGIALGLAFAFINPYVSWQSAGIGILAGGGTFYLISFVYYLLTKRVGMGGGDIKLLAMIGGFLGWQALPFVIFGSSLLGTIGGIFAMIEQRRGGKTVIPYGPFLAAASLLYLFFQERIWWLFITYVIQR